MLFRSPGTGIYYTECMRKLAEEEDEMWEANFLDGSFVPQAGRVYENSGVPSLDLYGCAEHEGRRLDVWACGQDLGSFTVLNGKITIPLTDDFSRLALAEYTASGTDFGDVSVTIRCDIEGTQTDQYVVPILVGNSFTSQGQMLRPNKPEETGAREGPGFGKTKRAHKVSALLHNSRGLSFGTRFDKLRPMKMVSQGGRAFDIDEAFSGVYTAPLEDTYSYDSQPCWEVSRPYPAVVCSFGAALNTEEQ